MTNLYSKDHLIEQTTVGLFQNLWGDSAFINAFGEEWEMKLGRNNTSEVVLKNRLKPALEKLNPDISANAIDQAIDAIMADKSTKSPMDANREIYEMLKNGVKVQIQNEAGKFESKKCCYYRLEIIREQWFSPRVADVDPRRSVPATTWPHRICEWYPTLASRAQSSKQEPIRCLAIIFVITRIRFPRYSGTMPELSFPMVSKVGLGRLAVDSNRFAQWKKTTGEQAFKDKSRNHDCRRFEEIDFSILLRILYFLIAPKGKTVKIIRKYRNITDATCRENF